jgi:hypothetical protein
MNQDSESRGLEVPRVSLGDRVHAVIRAGLGAIPIGGQAAIELFGALITPPLEKRRNEWMRSVGELLARLAEDKKVNLEELQRNDAFIDLLMEASQAAIRNANHEKREALRNAIRNAAIGHAPEEALQHMFVHWVDELTVWHLHLLKLFQDPKAWVERNDSTLPSLIRGGLEDILVHVFPELKGRRAFYDMLWNDLHRRGLVNTESLHAMKTGSALLAQCTSEIGQQFVRFIEVEE